MRDIDGMGPAEFGRIKTLFTSATELPVSDRTAFLDAQCAGDEATRHEVDALLACTPTAESFFRLMADAIHSGVVEPTPTAPDALIGTTIGRYRIEARVGAGGMGVVYRAYDTELRRVVALKLLPWEVGEDSGARRRFLTEARTAAALDHPNVCTVHEIGEMDSGQPFIVMTYCDGETLREKIARGSLPVDVAVTFGIQIARALAAAHARGVVHRDVKPGNVIIGGDGFVRLLDFGIARFADLTRTAHGRAHGTVAYAAPEQLRGEPVDARADLWSLGIMLYEMVTGTRPFRADFDGALIYAILNEPPEPLAQGGVHPPVELVRIIERLLQKDAGARYESASALIADLERVATVSVMSQPSLRPVRTRPALGLAGAGSAQAHSQRAVRRALGRNRWRGVAAWAAALVMLGLLARALWPRPAGTEQSALQRVAVLFFHDETANRDAGGIASTLTMSLIDALAGVPGLDVPSMNAVRPYRDGSFSIPDIAEGLRAEWLVGGFVDRQGDRVVVTAELSDATGRRLDYRQIARAASEELTLIEESVHAVAIMLRERLGRELRVQRWEGATRSPAAFRRLTLAIQQLEDADSLAARTQPRSALAMLHRADSTLARAADADPGWAEPRIERAWVARKIGYLMNGLGADRDSLAAVFQTGVQHATTALELRRDTARALEVRGELRYASWLFVARHRDAVASRWLLAEAERDLLAAVEADSTLVRALNRLSAIEYQRGDLERARLTTRRAYRADAYFQAEELLYRLFNITFENGQDAEAREWCAEIDRRFPQSWFIAYCRMMLMAWSPAEVADPDEAWRLADSGTAAAPPAVQTAIGAQLEVLVAGVLARALPGDSAVRVLDRIRARATTDPQLAGDANGRLVRLNLEAGVRVRLGHHERAVELLQEYLDALPDDRNGLSRSRRFRSLFADPALSPKLVPTR